MSVNKSVKNENTKPEEAKSTEDPIETPEDVNEEKQSDEAEERPTPLDHLKPKDYMKDMSKGARFKYIVYYYKWYFIVAALAIALITYFAVVIYRNNIPSSISYGVINAWDLSEGLDESLFEDYAEHYGRTDGYVIRGDNQYMFTTETITNPGTNYGAYLRFNSLCPDDYFDLIITDKTGLDFCVADDLSLDIDGILSEDIREMYKDRIVQMKDSRGEMHNFAIDVSGNKSIQRIGLPYDKVYITFTGDSQENITHAEEFLRFIYEED